MKKDSAPPTWRSSRRRCAPALLVLFVTGAPALALGLAAARWLLAGAALRPVAAVTARAAQISAADTEHGFPNQRATTRGGDAGRAGHGQVPTPQQKAWRKPYML